MRALPSKGNKGLALEVSVCTDFLYTLAHPEKPAKKERNTPQGFLIPVLCTKQKEPEMPAMSR